MEQTKASIVCGDGYPLAAELFRPAAARGCVVIAPALGVPRRVYEAFARYLAGRGLAVLTFDYRGVGDSRQGPVPAAQILMQHWGERDIEAVLGWAQRELKPKKLFLLGHSAGGQLPGLAPASARLDGLVLVAASAPHASLYPFPAKLGLLLLWWLLIPAVAAGREYFPARQMRLGSGDIAAPIVRQWARWARTPGYMFDPEHNMDTTRYARLSLPLLSYCFLDDGYAPPAAVNALLQHYSAAQVEKREVPRPARGQIGHFGYFRERQRDTLWRDTTEWLMRLC